MSWRDLAECRGLAWWFARRPPIAHDSPENIAYWEKRRAVCRRCPVREECLEEAVRLGEPSGMWGGRTPDERGLIRDKAGRYSTRGPKPCDVCGELFNSKIRGNGSATTCSEACTARGRAASHRAYLDRVAADPKECALCGHTLILGECPMWTCKRARRRAAQDRALRGVS